MFARNKIVLASALSAALLSSPAAVAGQNSALEATVTLPIIFTKTVNAAQSRAGDPVYARTAQEVRLADGSVIPSGARITGHVLAANPFQFDKTPYARQTPSRLSIHFDSVQLGTASVPLNVTVRAMAGPIATWGAREAKSSDLDSLGTVTQIGGDQLIPSQAEVRSMEGDVVAYNRRGGVYAHLIANGVCDANAVEVSVWIYSASACGLYGYGNISAQETGSPANPSLLTLASTHQTAQIWKNSTALLEVLSARQTTASR